MFATLLWSGWNESDQWSHISIIWVWFLVSFVASFFFFLIKVGLNLNVGPPFFLSWYCNPVEMNNDRRGQDYSCDGDVGPAVTSNDDHHHFFFLGDYVLISFTSFFFVKSHSPLLPLLWHALCADRVGYPCTLSPLQHEHQQTLFFKVKSKL